MEQSEIVSFLEYELAVRSPGRPTVRETHTAYVLLAGGYAHKLKKNIVLSYLDFSTLDRRKAFLEEELRINRELAGKIYRRILPVTMEDDGRLALDGFGRPVEWLLEMVRLPDADMLDHRLQDRHVTAAEVGSLGRVLCGFYARTSSYRDGAAVYLKHLRRESLINKEHLLAMRGQLPNHLSPPDLEHAIRLVELCAAEVMERGKRGLIVDGHGDLRLEHICLTDPPIVFDRLEFDKNMRQIDVYDEVGYLALEAEMAGHGWIGRDLLSQVQRTFKNPPSPRLMQAYGMFRMFLRARLAIDHLLEPCPKTPAKWVEQAQIYLAKGAEIAASTTVC
ncbi:Aminoglycoside phosphotransferase family enzyme [Ensifer adhaerens]|nr:Aminoglycoside phosphotransferase family enzyme [Ensifer adhaerens]